MRRLRVIFSMLGFAFAAIPASANITYTSCTSGCSSTSGSYATLPTEPGATGLSFSSLITFVSAGLNATTGIYTDPTTGAVFTNYYSGGSIDTGAELIGSSFVQRFASGDNTGIEIDLPANTYAIAMVIGDCSNGSCANSLNPSLVGLGTYSSHGSSYTAMVNIGSTELFEIVSDAPIASLFITSESNNNQLSINNFELGSQAPVPETATFFTMGGGLLGLYFFRRPRLRKLFRFQTPIETAAA